MLLCSEVYYALLEAAEERLTLAFINLGYARAILSLSMIFDELLDELGKAARDVLINLAKGSRIYSQHKHPNEVKRAVDSLMAKAIIEKSNRGSYTFVEPMLQNYLLNRFEAI
jgi:hypothetical protein